MDSIWHTAQFKARRPVVKPPNCVARNAGFSVECVCVCVCKCPKSVSAAEHSRGSGWWKFRGQQCVLQFLNPLSCCCFCGRFSIKSNRPGIRIGFCGHITAVRWSSTPFLHCPQLPVVSRAPTASSAVVMDVVLAIECLR